MKRTIKIILLSLLFFAALDGTCQTRYSNIPIESDDAYLIKVWANNEETGAWGWYDITETNIEKEHGWYFNREINITVDRFDVLNIIFVRGFDECSNTTSLVLYGNYNKTKIKDKPDLRQQVFVNGENQQFGTQIERPE